MSSERQITVGRVPVGGGAPVVVQSMTNTKTGDAAATLAQVRELAAAGCELVRVSLPTAEEAGAFAEVVAHSPVPIIADIHFDWRLALAAIERGAQGIRINPGTIAEKHVRDDRACGGGGARARRRWRERLARWPSASASTRARCRATCAAWPRASRWRRWSKRQSATPAASRTGASPTSSSR